MAITRDEFIKKLKKVNGLIYEDDVDRYYWRSDAGNYYYIYVYDEHFVFMCLSDSYEQEILEHPALYSFDELDQFLIDEGIVEPKFDAHDYLNLLGYFISNRFCGKIDNSDENSRFRLRVYE